MSRERVWETMKHNKCTYHVKDALRQCNPTGLQCRSQLFSCSFVVFLFTIYPLVLPSGYWAQKIRLSIPLANHPSIPMLSHTHSHSSFLFLLVFHINCPPALLVKEFHSPYLYPFPRLSPLLFPRFNPSITIPTAGFLVLFFNYIIFPSASLCD